MKQFEAHKFSEEFKTLFRNDKQMLDINEYEYCVNEWQGAHKSKTIRYYIYSIILFVGGMWAAYEQIWFMAVLLLVLAANYNRQSAHHILMIEIMSHQRLLAMLLNKVSKDIQADISGSKTAHTESFERNDGYD